MLEQSAFKELKNLNLSKDAEKTKSRIREVWSSTDKTQKEKIISLAGIARITVERSYKNGYISAKLALAMAQTAGVDPNYLIGASDERGECSDELINQFLTENGYEKFAASKNKRPYNRKQTFNPQKSEQPAAANIVPSADAPVIACKSDIPVPPEAKPAVEQTVSPMDSILSQIKGKIRNLDKGELKKFDTMTVETAERLLQGLYLRTEYSDDAKNLAILIKLALTL